MKKSYAVACSLILLAVPDLVRGQEPSQAIRARPEHMRAVIPLDDLKVDDPLFRVRLTPREPISKDVEADALPKIYSTVVPLPHYLRFLRIADLRDMTSSSRAEVPRSGVVAMSYSLVPGQLYLLDVRIESAGLTLELDSPGPGYLSKHRCQIDALLQKKIISVPAGPAQLLAVIERSDSLSPYDNCLFQLQESPPASTDGGWAPRWTFFSAELTRLADQ